MVEITGTVMNYFFHCHRQCWLFYNRINLEDNSEDVHIGKILHEIKSKGKNTEIVVDSVKLDKITDEYVIELKKSDADLEAAKMQLAYYLFILSRKGIDRVGKLQVIEKNKQEKTIHIVILNDEMIQKIEKVLSEIKLLLTKENPPEPVVKKGCKKCAYYEYCFL
ncbi:CRISPR-associated protein Cas4 [Alkalibaculum bacchi]|jgi:CRISPR-associated exonuclease Cas4|uniref:CRISPR-associated protein Cas4 n=1 Tax=Alkalibaculum bacchi TaxID=645887 RepID=UPI0026EE9005|nr:CRISPR-associated protein Cas4 [Alkalibaculum bacchi]